MQLRIVHTTSFTYDGQASASHNQARMTPQTTPTQIVLHSRLEVSPRPWTHEYRDYFGTLVTAFEVADPHQSMTVAATSTVQTEERQPADPTLTWADLDSPEIADRWVEYLSVSDLVEAPADFAERVRRVAEGSASPAEAARWVARLVHDEVSYVAGRTDVRSTAAQAWEQRSGVCQDMAHLVIGGLRLLGIPARYVSGYVHPHHDPVVGETVAGESHAWVEWWDGEWRPFDPTHDHEPQTHYVVVATGRDYDDVAPLRGIYSGTATSQMNVGVAITRLA